MAAIAHGWKPDDNPKIDRIPVKVAKEFNRADKLKKRGLISETVAKRHKL